MSELRQRPHDPSQRRLRTHGPRPGPSLPRGSSRALRVVRRAGLRPGDEPSLRRTPSPASGQTCRLKTMRTGALSAPAGDPDNDLLWRMKMDQYIVYHNTEGDGDRGTGTVLENLKTAAVRRAIPSFSSFQEP